MIQARFDLLDHHGRPVTETSFAGRPCLVAFGFTHCRVVCPRNLAKLSAALADLGPPGEAVQALYVSVDPARDTPAVLRTFLERHHPRFLGLTGTAGQVDAARGVFRVFARHAADPHDPAGYAVPHTAISYLLDPQGRCIDHYPEVLSQAEVAARLAARLDVPTPLARS